MGAFGACMLKNVERFSELMKFDFAKAELFVDASRTDKPFKVNDIDFKLTVYSDDAKLNMDLLQKNIGKFSTIYNTLKVSCIIRGRFEKHSN